MMRATTIAALAILASTMAGPALAQTVPSPAPAPVGEAPAPVSQQPTTTPALPGAPRTIKTSESAGISRNAPVNGVLTLFGNERCPTNKNGEEIVVCVRRSAEEQFRIPKEIRNFEVTPENESWATREKANQDAGAAGIGSCTTVGPGGGTGCFLQNARRAKTEVRARDKAATPDLP